MHSQALLAERGLSPAPSSRSLTRDSLLNLNKTQEFVKSEMQLNRMSNLLKDFNSENDFLNKQVIKLVDENKELRNALARQKTVKKNLGILPDANVQDFSYRYKNEKPVEHNRAVVVNRTILSGHPTSGTNFEESRFSASFQPHQSYVLSREFRPTQTTPPKTINRPPTNYVATVTTPEAQRTNQMMGKSNPINPQGSTRKLDRPVSVHRLNPTSVIIPTPKQSKGDFGTTPQITSRQSIDGQQRKRYLSLTNLKK